MVCNMNLVSIWFEYCKLIAFKRVYSILSRKRLNLYTLIKSFCFFILGIPKRFLDLFIYFLYNEKSFREGLEILYYHSYYEVKELKIEVLSGEITLNCNTVGKLMREIYSGHNELAVIKAIMSLKDASEEFRTYELKNQQFVKVTGAGLKTKEGTIINNPHYVYQENNYTMHATSNIEIKLDNSQFSDVAMGSFIKKGAQNPGTIISDGAKISFWTKNSKLIPMYEINALKFNKIEIFDLNFDSYKYIYDKNLIYKQIMLSHLGYVNEKLAKELTANYYTNNLSIITREEILEEMDSIRNIF